jgi:prostaglandin-endoperoxide synthase 2
MALRSSVWRRRGVKYTISFWIASNFKGLWDFLSRYPMVRSAVNEGIINQFVSSMEPRPARMSTRSPYTSWESLTDQTYSDRHLPERTSGPEPPPVPTVVELFRRPPIGGREAKKSTLLFPFFAQWFVDGFLRTNPKNPLRNQSTHAIDLSQLYGSHPNHTEILREGKGGRLKSQQIDGCEYPPYYTDAEGNVIPEFRDLKMIVPDQDTKSLGSDRESTRDTTERRAHLFALGLPRGNIHYGTALMSTVFLREHNRVAKLIAEGNGWNPEHDDERIFQTTRNVMIVKLLKVVIEDYINHISPFKFQFIAEPGIGVDRDWFRQNWMSIEFDMLYRWHTLVPDRITIAGHPRDFSTLVWDVDVLTTHGVHELVDEASKQPATEIGLMNTPDFLLDIEQSTLEMGRTAKLASYNDYRQACGYPRLSKFADVSSNPDVQRKLKACYGEVENVEFYPGLLAEDIVEGGVLGDLMGTMVGVDAFSQAMTNPLLDPRIFSADTFTQVGMAEIERTKRLADIVCPETKKPKIRISFDRA